MAKKALIDACVHLNKKLSSKDFVLGVIGLGYVGLPLAVEFAKRRVKVIGIDIDKRKIKSLLNGRSYIQDVATSDVSQVVRNGFLRAMDRFDALSETDAVIVCVPTPLNRVRDPDLSFIIQATDEIAKRIRKGQLIVLESTTYPGTTEEIIVPRLEKQSVKVGKDFFLCFSPERIDPGNKKFPPSTIPKVVGGITKNCTKLGALLYGTVFSKVVPVSSARTAEMAKLLENTFRIVNIGLVNELAMAADALRINIWEAIEAASSKPFGYMPFYPGPGVGGHCIGIDPIYLSWKAKASGLNLRFIELARDINTNMPRYVVERIQHLLMKEANKSANRARIMIIGASYKKNIDDIRESPALEVMEHLLALGAQVDYYDPYVPEVKLNHHLLKSKTSLRARALHAYDLVAVLTDHTDVPYDLLVKSSRLVLDTRNALKKYSLTKIHHL